MDNAGRIFSKAAQHLDTFSSSQMTTVTQDSALAITLFGDNVSESKFAHIISSRVKALVSLIQNISFIPDLIVP